MGARHPGASHDAAPAPSIGGAHFGVKWHEAIGMLDTSDDWATTFPGVTADSIVASRQATIRTFERAVVLDGSPLTLFAKYIGGGCHDSRRGVFP